ncbi:hypothetical protein [Sphingobium fluviale]|uniref:hypothetical protein n=1 Tax=Sphingobium fluviale TaxID=2506423 RepID=UPI0015F2EB2C
MGHFSVEITPHTGSTLNENQHSWVKLGFEGAAACLNAGVNDLGGVLMNESISRAAGASHGQEVTLRDLDHIAMSAGRPLRQRTTLYAEVPELHLLHG